MKEKHLIYVVGLLIIAALAYNFGRATYSMNPIPGYEGLHAGVEGVEILDGSYYRVDMDPGDSYNWLNSDPQNIILEGRANLGHWGAVGVEIDSPSLRTDWWADPKKVDYWLKAGEGDYKHVKGEIVVYRLPITVYAKRMGGTTQYTFRGEKMWFTLTSIVWDQAVQEQSPFTGAVG
jgi:hypothetical protein